MADETESLVQQALDMSHDLLHQPVKESFSEEMDDSIDEARRYSQIASECLQRNQLDEALAAYARAAASYQDHTESILSSVNAAGCYRNMGAVCRRLEEFDLAIVHLKTAEGWYKRAEASVAPYSPSLMSTSAESVCLDLLLIETMQSRATFHFRNPGGLVEAVKCHEECLGRLLDSTTSRDGAEMERVHFLPLSKHQETELLVVSVENLSGMYNMDPNLAIPERMNQLEHGIRVIRIRREQSRANDLRLGEENKDNLLLPLTQSLRYLSEIYLEKGQMDKAVDAMQDAMDLELASSKNPSVEALDAMDKLGTVNEELGNYDKALTCYEKAMFARSRMFGDQHVGVGKDLINVARIMELYGNTEGSLDLYKAAHDIYSKWVASENFHCDKEDAEAILQLIPNLFAQHRFAEARSLLIKCLEVAEEQSEDDYSFDKSQIYFDLGQASIGMEDFVSATIFLMEAAKTEGAACGDDALLLLERLESLQKGRYRTGIRSTQSWEAGETLNRRSRSRTPKRDSSVPARIGRTTREKFLPATVTPTDDVIGRDGSFGHSNYLSSGSTIPTVDVSDNDRGPRAKSLFDSPETTETSFRFVQHNVLGEESILDATVDEEKSDLGDDWQKLAPLLSPSATIYSDDALGLDPSPVSSEGRTTKKNRSVLPWSSSSPKKPKDDRSIGSQQFSSISKVFGRLRKQGFQSLPEQAMNDSDEFDATDLLVTDEIEGSDGFEVGLKDGTGCTDVIDIQDDEEEEEEEQATEATSELESSDGPCLIINVSKFQDDVSEITMKFETPKTVEESSTGTNNQEWWWGVTSEGFGRWFPSSYVSQAVQAADNFFSAKAIHSKSRNVPAAAQALASLSDDESEDEVSIEKTDFASNVGVGSMARIGMNEQFKSKNKHGQYFSYLQPPVDSDKDLTSEMLLHKERLDAQRKELGVSHPTVATTLFMLAVLHSRDSDIESAVNYAGEALTIQQSNGNHKDAARSLHFLGDLNLHQKNYQQSLYQYEKALRHEIIFFGFYSDETAKTRNCIGTVKLLQKKFSEAMESHEEALKILKECHGEDLKHPLVSETLCQIGSVYYRERNALGSKESSGNNYTTFIEMGMLEVIGQAHEDRGSYRMAISFYEEKLQVLENKPKNNETYALIATTLNGLGMLSTRAGLYSEALEYYGKAVRLQHKLGCDEVDLAAAQVLTGAVHFLLGRWDKALRQLEDARTVLEKSLGPKHETVAAAHYQLGLVQSAYCLYDSAMEHLSEALDIQSELLGQEHPATLRTRREIGNLYAVYEAELDSAFDNFHFVLDVQKRIHGDRHPNLAETLQSIGAAHARRREFTKALRALEDCYYMRVEFLGWDHPLQATTLHDIAKIQLQRGRIKKAIQICQIIMTIRQDTLSERHIDVAKTRLTQGQCLVAQGDTNEAKVCLKEALAIAQEKLGSSHPLVAEVHTEIGGLHLRKCEFDLARESIQKALDIYNSSNLDEDYFGVQEAKEKMKCVERDELLCV